VLGEVPIAISVLTLVFLLGRQSCMRSPVPGFKEYLKDGAVYSVMGPHLEPDIANSSVSKTQTRTRLKNARFLFTIFASNIEMWWSFQRGIPLSN